MRARTSAPKLKGREKASVPGGSPRPTGRTDDLAKGEVLAAAQQLHDAGPIRVHERLARQAKAERLFWERYAARWETMNSLKQEGQPHDLLAELASDPEILESPSFRDYLVLLIMKRREDYSRYSRQSDRVANALFGKRKDGAPTRFVDVVFDEIKLNRFEAFRDALQWANERVPVGLTEQHEILQNLKGQSFAMGLPARPSCLPETPPPSPITPEALVEQQKRTFNEWHLPELARHLSEHREERKGGVRGMDLSQRAIVWLLETWPKDSRYGPIGERAQEGAPIRGTGVDTDRALKELGRLQRNKRRRRRNLGDTTG